MARAERMRESRCDAPTVSRPFCVCHVRRRKKKGRKIDDDVVDPNSQTRAVIISCLLTESNELDGTVYGSFKGEQRRILEAAQGQFRMYIVTESFSFLSIFESFAHSQDVNRANENYLDV